MNWENIRYFLQVARSEQILAAARRLNADHATVSRRIASLENAIGTRLFDRVSKGVVLTAAGERLLKAAEVAEAEFLKAQSAANVEAMEVAGVVRLAVPDVFGAYMLPRILASLKQEHPRLTVQIIPLSRGLSLAKREADIAIAIGRPHEGKCAARKLIDYSLHFYASVDYLRRRGTPRSREALWDHAIVSYVSDLLVSDHLDLVPDFNRREADRLEYASAVAQIAAVRAGAGVGMLHDYAVHADPEMVRVLAEETCVRSYWLTCHLDNRDVPRNRIVMKTIGDYVKRNRSTFI